ncbi:hypothetical protein HMPREF1546_02185 [Oscillibacter sp. KLE 1745]|nr:hypothetical protein HMPREF1546_02185 [Oscillibacter sp. KLE 1745]
MSQSATAGTSLFSWNLPKPCTLTESRKYANICTNVRAGSTGFLHQYGSL